MPKKGVSKKYRLSGQKTDQTMGRIINARAKIKKAKVKMPKGVSVSTVRHEKGKRHVASHMKSNMKGKQEVRQMGSTKKTTKKKAKKVLTRDQERALARKNRSK